MVPNPYTYRGRVGQAVKSKRQDTKFRPKAGLIQVPRRRASKRATRDTTRGYG